MGHGIPARRQRAGVRAQQRPVLQLRVGQAPQPVATITGVVPNGEAGLLGLAVSPTYAQDQWVYAYFTSASDNRIVRTP